MSENSSIGWTNHTWNPVTGCTQISPGCENCYAKTIAESPRFRRGFPNGFDLTLHPDRIRQPTKWKTPSLIFVNSMSDLFHRDIPDWYIRQLWDVMIQADRHIYQVLTKRPHRMAATIDRLGLEVSDHIWIGTSVENQKFAENRIPALDQIAAPVKWLSCEPLLGPLDLGLGTDGIPGSIKWVVTGGESGSNHRPADQKWFQDIRDQCLAAGVPFFHKQGSHYSPGRDRELDGRTWNEYPPQVQMLGGLHV